MVLNPSSWKTGFFFSEKVVFIDFGKKSLLLLATGRKSACSLEFVFST
jgi:hypothetical protein